MLSSLGGVLQYVAQTGQRREVKWYLQNTTQESVLRDLLKPLRRRTTEIKNLEMIFNTHAHEDGCTRQRYWSEGCLRKHIDTTHPHLTDSEAVIQLLWRSFHFYAYHPFPRDPTNCIIDWEAFQRAVAMLAAQGADLLGVIEDIDSYWRFDGDNLYNQAKLKRIFRSIGTLERPSDLDEESTHILEETADVLAMTQPFYMHNGPHEHELTAVARRLLVEKLIRTRCHVRREDLKTLLGILTRLNLFKENWGLSFPFGSFELAESGADELTNILVNGLKGYQRLDGLEFDQVDRIGHILPNLHVRFYQMWAVLFQPPSAAGSEASHRGSSHIPASILDSISLFIPHPVISTLRESRGEDRRIALEDPVRLSNEPDGVTAMGVIDALSKDTRSHIPLVTGTDTTTSEPTVFGSYLPPQSNGVAVHLLFQLRPRFRLLRWSSATKTQVHTVTDKKISQTSVASFIEGVDKDTPFYIGESGRRNCIRMDPGQRVATLITVKENVEITLSDITILRVSGSVPDVVSSPMETKWRKDLSLTPPDSTEVRIQGEELKSRIMGFGSSG